MKPISVIKREDAEFDRKLVAIVEEKTSKTSCHNLIYSITISSAGIYLGYNLTIFNALGKPMLRKFSDVDPNDFDSTIALFNMIFGFGKMAGSFLGGLLSEKLGRKNALIIAEILSLFGYASNFFNNIWLIYAGRGFFGLTSGINSAVVPVILSEIIPIEFKGIVSM
jgi:MFS family permease